MSASTASIKFLEVLKKRSTVGIYTVKNNMVWNFKKAFNNKIPVSIQKKVQYERATDKTCI